MFQNSLGLNQTQSMPTLMPYSFTSSELDSLRAKLQLAEQQLLSVHNKNAQSIIHLSLNEIRTLQKMIEMTYLQGISGSSGISSFQQNVSSSSSSGNTPPNNYLCHKCGISGHYVHDCPNVIGKGSPPTNYVCHKCNLQGHWIKECPLGSQPDYGKLPPLGYCCHRCGIPGHWIKHCPTNDESLDNSNYPRQRQKERERDNSNYGYGYGYGYGGSGSGTRGGGQRDKKNRSSFQHSNSDQMPRKKYHSNNF